MAHFRKFLQGKFSLELLLFYQEVDKYRCKVLTSSQKLIDLFITRGSPNEINIQSEMRDEILNSFQINPSLSMFDDAYKEVFKLMRGSFQEFLQSELAMSYLDKKKKERVVIIRAPSSPGGYFEKKA